MEQGSGRSKSRQDPENAELMQRAKMNYKSGNILAPRMPFQMLALKLSLE